MESLPDLPLEQILVSLNVADLLACSLVSTSWRSKVNNDYVWKKICHGQCNKYTIDYLQSAPPTVLPTFKDPEQEEHSTLEDLCYWRIVFMKVKHLEHNWSTANHDVHNVAEYAHNFFDIKIDKNTLIGSVSKNQCELWNVEEFPCKQQTISCALKNTSLHVIHLFDNTLVIIQDTLLQVYKKSDEEFQLCFRRLFNKAEADSDNIPGSLYIDDWYNENVKLGPKHIEAFLVGNYFIGVAENGKYASGYFHIWDTITGSKLKAQPIQELVFFNDPIYMIEFCPPKTDLGKILVSVRHSECIIVHIYDLVRLVSIGTIVLPEDVHWISFEDRLVITIGHDQPQLNIYNSSGGEKLFSNQYEYRIIPESVQVHGDYLGFSTRDMLVVLKTTDFDVVFTRLVKCDSNLSGFDFIFLDWNLILISAWDDANRIEVWSIEKQCRLSTLNASGIILSCSTSAKFFIWTYTKVLMLQFW